MSHTTGSNSRVQHNSVSQWLQINRKIWVKATANLPNPQQDQFLQGAVTSISGNVVTLLLSGSNYQYKVPILECLKLTYGEQDVADMVDLEELNQPELLFNIKRRYNRDMIFTYCGPTLVIINPYKSIEALFNTDTLIDYQTRVFLQNLEYKSLAPHIFALTAFCLWQLFYNERSQAIVISGESGAGKTQNTKYALKFLSSLGKNIRQKIDENKSKLPTNTIRSLQRSGKRNLNSSQKLVGIQDRILGCNEVLEAFGNAKTIRNDNSSRFGKLIILIYGQTQSRIVSMSQGQRNYHIFYYMMKGLTAEERRVYHLSPNIQDYFYMNQSSVVDVGKPGDDVKNWNNLKAQFEQYLSLAQIDAIYRILAAVLNIGAQIVQSPLKFDEAVALRDSFAKNLYQRIFNFLVNRLNQKIQIQKINLEQPKKGSRKSIGLLDIFGFQVLTINNLQQFFINFANEKLQQLYVSYIFKEQQNDFLKQGLSQFTNDIGFQDNKPIIDLMEQKPMGLFHLINQSSELNLPDNDLPDIMVSKHKNNKFLIIPKSKRNMFQIQHSCSPVNYSVLGFTAKNKDQFPSQMLQIILKSSINSVSAIVKAGGPSVQQSSASRQSNKFLTSKFLQDMNRLTEELYSCDCHFVRCVKPNNTKTPNSLVSKSVLQSLRYLGVLDSIIIRKLGYIYRRPFSQFYKKFYQIQQYGYGMHAKLKNKSEELCKEQCKKLINKYALSDLNQKKILFGTHKILVKESALNNLQSLLKQRRKIRSISAKKIKDMFKRYRFRKQVRAMMLSLRIFKSYLLSALEKTRTLILDRNVRRIQTLIKKFLWQKHFEKIKEQAIKSVTKIGAFFKMKRQRRQFLQIKSKVVKVQSLIRAHLMVRSFIRYKFCYSFSLALFQTAWLRLRRQKIATVNKILKSFSLTQKFQNHLQLVLKINRIKKIKQIFTRSVFEQRLLCIETQVQKYIKPIIILQRIVRRRYFLRTLRIVRLSVDRIKKAYLKHHGKRFKLLKQWREALGYYNAQQQKKAMAMQAIGYQISQVPPVKIDQTQPGLITMSALQKISNYADNLMLQLPHLEINQHFCPSDKNTVQIIIGDFEPIGQKGAKWLNDYEATKKLLKERLQYPISCFLGKRSSVMVSHKHRAYTWGNIINAFKIDIPNITETEIVCCDDQIIALNGLGINLLKSDSNSLQLISQSFKKIFCNHGTIYTINSNGDLFQGTPLLETCGLSTAFQNQVKDVRFFKKIQQLHSINSVAASEWFVHFLTNDGKIYSKGYNPNGQLGIGKCNQKPVNTPILNTYLTEPIQTIAVGIGHSIAKSKLGYVYVWGCNDFNQCLPVFQSYYDKQSKTTKNIIPTPKLLQVDKSKVKALQIAAGAKTSYLLLQNRSPLQISSSGLQQLVPLQTSTQNEKDLLTIKLRAQWNSHVSVLFLWCLDLRKVKFGAKMDSILKHAKNISKQWNHGLYPTYNDYLESIFGLGDLAKFKFTSIQTQAKKEQQKQMKLIDELKALMQLRKSSTVFKQNARDKSQIALKRLQQKPQSSWTVQDHQLFQYIIQNCLPGLK